MKIFSKAIQVTLQPLLDKAFAYRQALLRTHIMYVRSMSGQRFFWIVASQEQADQLKSTGLRDEVYVVDEERVNRLGTMVVG